LVRGRGIRYGNTERPEGPTDVFDLEPCALLAEVFPCVGLVLLRADGPKSVAHPPPSGVSGAAPRRARKRLSKR
jgi:hypothetical protein